MRGILIMLGLIAGVAIGTQVHGTTEPARTAEHVEVGPIAQSTAPNGGPCCRICSKGKACGNTCIARDRNCWQPPGCACDGN